MTPGKPDTLKPQRRSHATCTPSQLMHFTQAKTQLPRGNGVFPNMSLKQKKKKKKEAFLEDKQCDFPFFHGKIKYLSSLQLSVIMTLLRTVAHKK